MALLNYAVSLTDLQNKGGLNYSQMSNWNDNDKLKLILTGDKHIITHGVDLLADYANGVRGLVPAYDSDLNSNYGILTKEGWTVLTTDYLPISTSITNDDGLIPTNKAVMTYVGDFVKAAETMRFMGVISLDNEGNYSYVKVGESETQSGFPTTCQVGDTYRVGTNGTYAGVLCEAGDILICIKDGSENLNNTDYWTVVQTNIGGTEEITLNGSTTPLKVYSNGGSGLSFYAPTNIGSAEDILISDGSTPVWKSPSQITVGVAKTLDSAPSLSTSNGTEIKVTVGDKPSDAFTVPFATEASHALIATEASKLKNVLTIGNGLKLSDGTESYDGYAAKTLLLKPATTTTLGGVIVNDPDYLTLSEDGSLTFNKTALEGLVGGQVTAAKYTLSAENIENGVNLKLSGTLGDSTVPIKGSGNIGVGILDSDPTVVTVSLNEATNSYYGGIKIGYNTDEANKKYAIQLEDGKAYVHVPWTDTNNTWRAVNVNNNELFGTSVVENNILNFVDSESIQVNITEANAISFTTKLNSDAGLEIVSGKGIGLKATGVTANSYGPTANITQSSGTNATINVPVITVDKYGRITQAESYSFTAVDTIYTNGTGLSLLGNTFSLNKATDNTLGGIQVGYTESGQNYAVKLDDSGNAYVNVPWQNTNTNREIKVGNETILESNNLGSLTFNGNDKTTVSGSNGIINISSTWRDIFVGETSIGDQSLKFVPTGDIYVKSDVKEDNIYELSFGLSWYNISAGTEGEYEYVQ